MSTLSLALEAEAKIKALIAGLSEPPPKEETPEGEVLWTCTGDKPLHECFSGVSDQEHCGQVATASNLPDSRISIDPTASLFTHGHAVKFLSKPGDTGCYSGRSELIQALGPKDAKHGVYHKGDHVWTANEYVFGPTFPLHDPAYPRNAGTIYQFHTMPEKYASTVGLAIGPNNGTVPRFSLWGELGVSGVFGPEVKAGVLYRVLLDILFDPAVGHVNAYVAEGKNTPELALSLPIAKTLNPAENTVEVHMGWYFDTLRKETKDAALWATTVAATTRAAAEAKAF